MTPGELRSLLQRCRADETAAWERFTHWVGVRGKAILGPLGSLSRADRDDIVAAGLNQLVPIVREDRIRGDSNAEIDAYVCAVIRNQGLNFLRRRLRHREGGASDAGTPGAAEPPHRDIADERSAQDVRAMASEQLGRAHKLMQSWALEDRYLFLAKINGVPARIIQRTLNAPPFGTDMALRTADTRFHRLRARLMRHLEDS